MKSLFKKTLSSKGLRQSMQVTLANIFATGLGAIAIIVLSRVLDPKGFGAFSVAFSLLAILAKVADVGINIAMQKRVAQTFEAERKLARRYAFEAAKIKFLLVFFVAIIGWFISPWLDAKFLRLNDVLIIRLSFIFASVVAFFDYFQFLLQSIHSFTKSVVMLIIQALFKIMAVFSLAILKSKNVLAAFSFYGIGPLIAVIFSYIVLPHWLKSGYENAKKERIELVSLAKFTAVAVIAATIADNIDTLLVQKYMTTYDTGIFSAASKIALLFSVVAYSLGSVLNPRVARYRQKRHLEKYLKKTFALAAVITLFFIILIPFSKYLIIFSSGPSYLSGIKTLQILLISSAVFIITMPYVAVFYAMDSPSYFAISGVLQIIVLIGVDVFLIPHLGIDGAAYGRLIARSVVLVYTFLFAFWAIKKQPEQ